MKSHARQGTQRTRLLLLLPLFFHISNSLPLNIDIDGVRLDALENVPYTSQVVALGGTPPFLFSVLPSGVFPPSVLLNASTGLLQGSFPWPANLLATFSVTDALGHVALSRSVTITIGSPTVLVAFLEAAPQCESGVFCVVKTQISGGTPPYSTFLNRGFIFPRINGTASMNWSTAEGSFSGVPLLSNFQNAAIQVLVFDSSSPVKKAVAQCGKVIKFNAPLLAVTTHLQPTCDVGVRKMQESFPTFFYLHSHHFSGRWLANSRGSVGRKTIGPTRYV